MAARTPARLCGWCNGASGSSSASCASTSAPMRTGCVKRVPPWTMRWPTATMGAVPACPARQASRACKAPACVASAPTSGASCSTPPCRSRTRSLACKPGASPSAWPTHRGSGSTGCACFASAVASAIASNRAHRIDDEPALSVSSCPAMRRHPGLRQVMGAQT